MKINPESKTSLRLLKNAIAAIDIRHDYVAGSLKAFREKRFRAANARNQNTSAEKSC
jgi:hypothetical protein